MTFVKNVERPEKIVFIDETWAKTNMTPLYGWAEIGKRVIDQVPHEHWKTTTFLVALRHEGLTAPMPDQKILRNYSCILASKTLYSDNSTSERPNFVPKTALTMQTASPPFHYFNIAKKIWREVKRPFKKIYRLCSTPIKRYCPVCRRGFKKLFEDVNSRPDVQCTCCGSLERHRFIWLLLDDRLCRQEHSNCSLLHFAPELCFSQHFEKLLGDNYVTGDIQPGRAKHVVDITNICFPENNFDYILCIHVLEHIIDDIAALKELYRVLKPGGTAYLSVPLRGQNTYEDYSCFTPEERTKHFGQWDHVRIYGEDIIERIRTVGFSIEAKTSSDLVQSDSLRKTLGLNGGKLFVAKK